MKHYAIKLKTRQWLYAWIEIDADSKKEAKAKAMQDGEVTIFWNSGEYALGPYSVVEVREE